MTEATLAGLTVLVTRPVAQASSLARRIEQLGGRAVIFPTIEILPADKQSLRAALEAVKGAQAPLFIFVSRAAVEHGLQSVTEIFGQAGILSAAAVGPATAKLLQDAGIADVVAPARSSGSEALLEELANIPMKGRQVVILRGPSGREKLAHSLTEQGAMVAQLEAYERRQPDTDASAVGRALTEGTLDAVTVTSTEVFSNLIAMLDSAAGERLRKTTLVVPSPRVVKMVRQNGATGEVLLANGSGDAAIIEALGDWQRKRHLVRRDEDTNMSEDKRPENAADRPGGTPEEAETPAADATDEAVPAEETAEAPASRDAAAGEEPVSEPRTVVVEKRGGGGLAALALLLAIAAAAGSGYLWWLFQNQGADATDAWSGSEASLRSEIRALREELGEQLGDRDDQLSDLVSDQQGVALRLKDVDQLSMRMGGIEAEMENMRGVSAGARRNWMVAEAGYYLQAANASLQLNRNVTSALSALDAADDRLASLSDPSLLPVREAIAAEKQALSGLGDIDVTGIALALGSLAVRASDLRTKTDNPAAYATPDAPGGEEEASGVGRATKVLGDALKSMVTVRRTDQQATALLAPKEEFFLTRNLEMQLLTARLALLKEQPDIFRQSVDTSLGWLYSFFDTESPEVADTIRILEELRETEVRPEMPDISGSLALLRAAQAESATP